MAGTASQGGKEFRTKLADFLKIYGGSVNTFSANPTKPKTIEIPSYLAAKRNLNLRSINMNAGKK